MDNTASVLPARRPIRPILVTVGGVILVAVVIGYLYFFVTVRLELEFLFATSLLFGVLAGFTIALIGRRAKFIAPGKLAMLAFLVGLGICLIRYHFSFNYEIDQAVQQALEKYPSILPDELRSRILQGFTENYPPGGLFGYLCYLTESGFVMQNYGSGVSDATLIRGAAWVLLVFETFVMCAAAAGICYWRQKLDEEAVFR